MIFGGGSVWLQKRVMCAKKGEFYLFPPFILSHVFFSSSWLHKARNGSNKYTRMVWVTAVILLLLIAGGIALGVFLRRNVPANQQPTALGGSANNSLVTSTSSVVSGPATQASQTSLHVSPTFTLGKREPEPSSMVQHSKPHRMYAIRRFDKLD